MEKQQQEMQMKMQQEMQKLGVQAPQMQFGTPQMQMPMAGFQQPDQNQAQGPTYVYGPNGELIPKEQWNMAKTTYSVAINTTTADS